MESCHERSDPVRPRFGLLTRSDGSQVPLVFHPTDDPDVYLARRADTEAPVRMTVGDQLSVDAIGGGQSLLFA